MIKELEYPFNTDYILKHKKKIKSTLLETDDAFLEKRIAVLGGSTTKLVTQILELFLLNYGIKPHFYESEYNRYYEEGIFLDGRLTEFKPDVIYVHTSNRNIAKYPEINDSAEQINCLLETETIKFNSLWDNISNKFNCPIIQNNFEMPLYRLMGNKDASDIHGAVNFLNRLNMKFYEYAQTHNNFYICDINYISADYGLNEWADPFYWYMYKYALNISAIPFLSFNVANIIKSIYGKNKKGLVLDLDNTLWGGIIGDDGADGILIGPEDPQGEAYLEFQAYLKAQKQLGVLLNVASKNDYDNAMEGINHPNGILSQDDFICIKVNWQPKDKNVSEIAAELNILPESVVFVDDSPAERDIVTGSYNDICAPEITEVHEYIKTLDRSGFFETTVSTNDDAKRNIMYKENAKRTAELGNFDDYNDYLRSLNMTANIKSFNTADIARIAQLTNKSNQFNFTTRRYTQTDIEKICDNPKYISLCGRLSDKFGDNGIVSVIIARVENDECHIELFLMSCRVLKRDMEYSMADALIKRCMELGINNIYGYYYPTAKNNMVKTTYELLGYKKIKEDETGNTLWQMRIDNSYKNKNNVIKIIE